MADPTKFLPGYSYSGFQANYPSDPLPAEEVDNDMANIALSLDETVDAIKDIRRSDGALKNGLVTIDSLSPAAKVLLGVDNLPDELVENIDSIAAVGQIVDEVVAVAAIDTEIVAVSGNIAAILGVNAQALLASRWANEVEDVVVVDGLYSAKHWAAKAQAIVLGDVLASGVQYSDTYNIGGDNLQDAVNVLAAAYVEPLAPKIYTAGSDAASSTPTLTDRVMFLRNSSADLRRTTWSNVVTLFRSVLDGVYAAAVHNQAWSTITGRPTTLAGYGIVDAAPLNPGAGAVGSYALAYRPDAQGYSFGELVAGGNLRATTTEGNAYAGPLLSGTWRAMGASDGGAGDQSCTIFQRIA